jgi:hypothetical protein
MSDKIEFKSAIELYNRVLPSLYFNVKVLNGLGIKHITEKDIWIYLVNNDWTTKTNLELSDLISDILYCDNEKLNKYVSNKISNRNINEEEIL